MHVLTSNQPSNNTFWYTSSIKNQTNLIDFIGGSSKVETGAGDSNILRRNKTDKSVAVACPT
jgi:hypothetical protein